MANFPPRFGWGFFRDLLDWTPATAAAYGNPQIKADFLKLAADAPVTIAATLTAHAGGGQSLGTRITKDFTNITTVATAGDSVKLPAAIAGLTYTIVNNGANSADVFPSTGDTINGGSANAAIKLPAGACFVFTAIDTTDWKTNQVRLATGDGTVALPAHSFSTQPNMGLYKVSSTQLGAAVGGVLKGGFDANGVFTDVISEQTSTVGVTIDGVLLKDGGVSANSTFAGFIPAAAPQALSGAGAVNLTTYQTQYTSTATGDALTLADATQIGQLKKISYVAEAAGADTGVLHLTGYTSITFNAINDYALLMWNGTAWIVIEYAGVTIV